MAQTLNSLRLIISDVKSSWFFRIWGGIWVFSFFFAFAIMISLSHKSDVLRKDRYVEFWLENATQVYFPRWHFRVDSKSPITFLNQSCHWNGVPISIQTCSPWHGIVHPINKCFAVNAGNFSAVQQTDILQEGQRIACTIQTSNTIQNVNTMIAWELDGDQQTFGPNAYSSVWISPTSKGWVMLKKSTYKPHNKPIYEEWERTLLYHSMDSAPGQYGIETIIGSFEILHYEEQDLMNGWVTVGQIGGFIFMLGMIQTLVMIFLGVCLSNDSSFLNQSKNSAAPDYRTL